MSSFAYRTNIGSYSTPMRLDITLETQVPLSQEDYETARKACETLEKLALKLQPKAQSQEGEK